MHSLIWHYALSHWPILPQILTYVYVVLVSILVGNVKILHSCIISTYTHDTIVHHQPLCQHTIGNQGSRSGHSQLLLHVPNPNQQTHQLLELQQWYNQNIKILIWLCMTGSQLWITTTYTSQSHRKKWSSILQADRMVPFILIRQHFPAICQRKATCVIKCSLIQTPQHCLRNRFEL